MSRFGLLLTVPLLMVFACSSERIGSEDTREKIPEAVQLTVDETMAGIPIDRSEFTVSSETGNATYHFEIVDTDNIVYWLEIAEDGSLLGKSEERQLSMKEGQLFNEDEPFWIQAVYFPEAVSPEQYPVNFQKAVYALSEVGANTLAFDLIGITGDGDAFAPGSVEHFHTVLAELLEFYISGVCRVLGSQSERDLSWRRNAVRTAAQALIDEPQFVYWIDGEDAEELVAEFKRLAPNLVVAGPGGDLLIAEAEEGAHRDPATIWMGRFPEFQPGSQHILVKGEPEDLEFLDTVNRQPIESEPWDLDDSILSEEERAQGFKPLFDGETLQGWSSFRKGRTSFVVRDGVIEWVRRGAGALQFNRRFSDFVLRFEYKVEEGGNSGVHLRSPRSNRASRIGFEVQLLGDHGKSPTKGSTGAIYSVIPPTKNPSRPAGEWNEVEVTAEGPFVKVVFNGDVVQDVNFEDYPELKNRLRRGFIRLTDHGDFAAFRNIRIKEL